MGCSGENTGSICRLMRSDLGWGNPQEDTEDSLREARERGRRGERALMDDLLCLLGWHLFRELVWIVWHKLGGT